MLQIVRRRKENDQGQATARQILLLRYALINRNEDIESS